MKPLDGMGGTSIFRVRRDDPNRNVIFETVAHCGARSVMIQRYIPEIADGDKRVLVIAGLRPSRGHRNLELLEQRSGVGDATRKR